MKAVLLLFLLTLSLFAEVAGKWKIHSEGSNGMKTDAVLELREDWGAWNGTIVVNEDKIQVNSVVVDGDKVSFEVGGDGVTYTVKAEVKGDRLEGTFTATDGVKGTVKGQRQ